MIRLALNCTKSGRKPLPALSIGLNRNQVHASANGRLTLQHEAGRSRKGELREQALAQDPLMQRSEVFVFAFGTLAADSDRRKPRRPGGYRFSE